MCAIRLDDTQASHFLILPLLQVPLVACNECIDLLLYDDEHKPLTGEMAGEVPHASPQGDEPPTSPCGEGEGGARGGGPKGWRLYQRYFES